MEGKLPACPSLRIRAGGAGLQSSTASGRAQMACVLPQTPLLGKGSPGEGFRDPQISLQPQFPLPHGVQGTHL